MANFESKKVLNFLGWIATVFIALAILIAAIVGWIQTGKFNISLAGLSISDFPTALVCIANIFAYLIAAIGGFCYAKSKRNIWFMVIQVVATIVILFVVITSLF